MHILCEEMIPVEIAELLPVGLYEAIMKTAERTGACTLEEIRLRRNRFSSIVADGKNITLGYCLSDEETEEIFGKMCRYSPYAFTESVNRGYISMGCGIRVGVSGKASVENGNIVGVSDVSSLCIRIPHECRGVGKKICRMLKNDDCFGGILIYSPPGVGKTTLLRVIARSISSGENAKRTVIVDTRDELVSFIKDKYFCADYLIGYPKDVGIEIALRSMNAEVIISDEISGESECAKILSAQSGGAVLIASAHASDISELFSNRVFREIHKAHVFRYYVGISRADGGAVGERDYIYSFKTWEEADRYYV